MSEDTSQRKNHLPEKRRYFRIEDKVLLEYIEVRPDEIHDRSPESFFPLTAGFKLIRELQSIDHESAHILGLIAENNREVADYLKILNQKLEFLARTFVGEQHKNEPVQPRSISLGEGGLAFLSETGFPVQTLLALKITLLTSYIGLLLFGRVVDCVEQSGTNEHRISLEFSNLSEQDQHTIARHVIKVQAQRRRGG